MFFRELLGWGVHEFLFSTPKKNLRFSSIFLDVTNCGSLGTAEYLLRFICRSLENPRVESHFGKVSPSKAARRISCPRIKNVRNSFKSIKFMSNNKIARNYLFGTFVWTRKFTFRNGLLCAPSPDNNLDSRKFRISRIFQKHPPGRVLTNFTM